MESKDLRLGNYVCKSLKSGNGRKLNQKVLISDLERLDEGLTTFNYEPIPLTEDILLKCGFFKDEFNFQSSEKTPNLECELIDPQGNIAFSKFLMALSHCSSFI